MGVEDLGQTRNVVGELEAVLETQETDRTSYKKETELRKWIHEASAVQ